ncbi:branched-chain amino acid transport [Zhengella mangrovi]|uniref:Branched-chain amino acid transport n=1 Tax=Zhengella mangrovi TaxID=1982044 RepID=A0A2G1QHW9_9HYPH|nr:AzlD domain-containing protein [Zhengella mangrovi]PHP65060.1 branched-chain amino acid transport [Zhengella mangrovi]
MTVLHGDVAWWWPYVFIVLAGWLPTDVWRWAGVALGGRLDETSRWMVLVRCVATALVAAVIGNLVVYPQGPLGDLPVALRIGALAAGFAAYLLAGKRMIAGILTAEAALFAGVLLSGA